MAAAPCHHPLSVSLRTGCCDDGRGEAELPNEVDEADGVRRITWHAAVEDDGVDHALVREEDFAEFSDRCCLDDCDAVVRQRRLPRPDYSGQVVGDQDERY